MYSLAMYLAIGYTQLFFKIKST